MAVTTSTSWERPIWRWRLKATLAASPYGGMWSTPIAWWDFWTWLRPRFAEGRWHPDGLNPWWAERERAHRAAVAPAEPAAYGGPLE